MFLSLHIHSFIQRLLQKSIESFCLHSQEVVKFLSIQLFSHDIIKIIHKNWNKKERNKQKSTCSKVNSEATTTDGKTTKISFTTKKFLSSSSHSFYFTLFHQQNNTWKWMWRMKRREKVQLKFRDKKSIFMSSYIFYETAVCYSWLFCCRCK